MGKVGFLDLDSIGGIFAEEVLEGGAVQVEHEAEVHVAHGAEAVRIAVPQAGYLTLQILRRVRARRHAGSRGSRRGGRAARITGHIVRDCCYL